MSFLKKIDCDEAYTKIAFARGAHRVHTPIPKIAAAIFITYAAIALSTVSLLFPLLGIFVAMIFVIRATSPKYPTVADAGAARSATISRMVSGMAGLR